MKHPWMTDTHPLHPFGSTFLASPLLHFEIPILSPWYASNRIEGDTKSGGLCACDYAYGRAVQAG